MASRKRARTAVAASPSSSSTAAASKITLSGGEAHHSSLAALWRQEKLTDIALCAEGVEFKAHRAALASSSGYFLSLFDSGMRDAASPTHTIEGLRSPVLEALLAFVYEGSCEVEEGLLTEMLDAAARLVIDPLKAACAYAIQAQLTPYNALDVWRLADLYTLPALEKAAVTSALGGFEELPPQSASGAQVLALVQEDRLEVKNEEAVFQWVVRWWEAGKRPVAELLAAMRHVRFAAMDTDFVETTVRTWPALDSTEGRSILFDGHTSSLRHSRRSGLGPRLVYVLGGNEGDDSTLSRVDVYDPRTDAWKQVSSMPTNRFLHGGAALDGKIYVMGRGSGDVQDTADVYDPQSDEWQPLANMECERACFAAAAAEGKIYAIGGAAEGSTEAFDPHLGTWACVTSMGFGRVLHAVAVVDGKIYAIGGFDGNYIESVEVYDPRADIWQQIASLPQARRGHAAAAMGGKIFVSGGLVEGGEADDVMSTLMVFDPQTNTWTALASMGTARAYHTSATICGKLYIFGGNAGGALTASVEAYDPISNTWARVADMSCARDAFVAVAL